MLLSVIVLILVNLLLLSCVWAQPGQKLQPVQKQFANWQVTCSNQNVCHARNNTAHYGLVMTVHYGINGAEKLSIRLASTQPPAAITSWLLLDKKPLVLPQGQWQVLPSGLITEDSLTISRFLRQISQGNTISLSHTQGTVSLKGLQQTLKFIRQRITEQWSVTQETDTGAGPAALARDLTAEQQKPAAFIPLSKAERRKLQEFVYWRIQYNQCSLPAGRRQISINILDNDTVLVLLSCEGGAYNVVYLAWLVSRDLPYTFYRLRLWLPFTAPEIDPEVELINAEFDPQRKEITTLAKGRAPGDCGVATRWRYTDGRFRLIRYGRQPVCDGWYQHARQWPLLWLNDP